MWFLKRGTVSLTQLGPELHGWEVTIPPCFLCSSTVAWNHFSGWIFELIYCKGNRRWMVLCTPSHCPWLVLLARLQHPTFKVHASHYIFRKIAEKRQKSPPLLPYLLRKNCSDYKLFWRFQGSTFSRVPLIKKVLQQNSFVHSHVYTK